LAIGSASLLSFLLALIGFYLVRGRIVEDIRSGIISTRDYQSAMEYLTGVGRGGANWRYIRHLAASVVLGLLFVDVIIFRLSFATPLMALALSVGIVSMSAAASFFGKLLILQKLLCPYIYSRFISRHRRQRFRC
jgi:hypothetical protein